MPPGCGVESNVQGTGYFVWPWTAALSMLKRLLVHEGGFLRATDGAEKRIEMGSMGKRQTGDQVCVWWVM